MAAIWDSREFALTERSDALRQTIRDEVVDVDMELPERPEDITARVALQNVGTMQICSVRAMPTIVTRTPRRARQDSEPSLFVTLQLQGSSMMVQHGREAVLQPGDLAVYATTDPYTLVLDRGVRNHFFRVPLLDLGLPADLVRDVSARTLRHDDPVVRLTSDFMRDLARAGLDGHAPFGTAAVELLRSTLLERATQGGTPEAPRPESALVASVDAYIARHLKDPELSAASIAAAHHVSVRHLYAVLAAAGIALGDTIRTQRLDGARRDLARPDLASRTVAAIGRAWAFPNATHFSRVFRQEYGVSPLEWRMRQSP
jgi:AraC-like DNA-binding protein